MEVLKLTQNADPDKSLYSCYNIEDIIYKVNYLTLARINLSLLKMSLMSSSVHIDNKKKKKFYFLGKGPTQRLVDTMLTANAQY